MSVYSVEQTKEELYIRESAAAVDLSDYYTKAEVDAKITGELPVDTTTTADELGTRTEWGLS